MSRGKRKEKEEEECETVRRWMTNLLSGRERKVGGGSVPVLSTAGNVVSGFKLTGGLFIYFDSSTAWTINDASFCSDNPIKPRTHRHKHAHAHYLRATTREPTYYCCWAPRKMQRQKEWKNG